MPSAAPTAAACTSLHHMPALWKTKKTKDKTVIVCKQCGRFIGYPPPVTNK